MKEIVTKRTPPKWWSMEVAALCFGKLFFSWNWGFNGLREKLTALNTNWFLLKISKTVTLKRNFTFQHYKWPKAQLQITKNSFRVQNQILKMSFCKSRYAKVKDTYSERLNAVIKSKGLQIIINLGVCILMQPGYYTFFIFSLKLFELISTLISTLN